LQPREENIVRWGSAAPRDRRPPGSDQDFDNRYRLGAVLRDESPVCGRLGDPALP
jgi:hypothetical protein